MATKWTFDNIDNKHSLYRGEDCMKTLCCSLRENVTVNKKRAKITPRCEDMLLTFVEENLQKSLLKINLIKKLETIIILLVNIEMQHINSCSFLQWVKL